MARILRIFIPLLSSVVIFIFLAFTSFTLRKGSFQRSIAYQLEADRTWQEDYRGPAPNSIYPYLVYVYNGSELAPIHKKLNMHIDDSTFEAIASIDYTTREPAMAGWFVVLLGNSAGESENQSVSKVLDQYLPFWDNGRSHVIVNLVTDHFVPDWTEILDMGKAIVAQPIRHRNSLRTRDDIVTPVCTKSNTSLILPLLTPIHRRKLVTFHGRLNAEHVNFKKNCLQNGAFLCPSATDGLPKSHNVQAKHINHPITILFTCSGFDLYSPYMEWTLCGDENERRLELAESLFTLVPVPPDQTVTSTVSFQHRLLEALMYGSIPVIVGDQSSLPFSELLDWRRACVFLPRYFSRNDTLAFLSKFTDASISSLRRHGRHIWMTYGSSWRSIVETTLLNLRVRHHIINPPALGVSTEEALNVTSPLPLTVLTRFIPSTDTFHRPGDVFHSYSSTPFNHEKALDGSDHIHPQSGPGKLQDGLNVIFDSSIHEPETARGIINQMGVEKQVFYLVATKPYRMQNFIPPLPIFVGSSSVNNVFQPYDVVTSDALLIMRQTKAVFPSDFTLRGLRHWRIHQDEAVLFYTGAVPGHIGICYFLANRPGAMLIHKYYLYLYMYTVPSHVKSILHDNPRCADPFFVFFISHISGKAPHYVFNDEIQRPCSNGNECTTNRLREEDSDDFCSDIFLRHYGYIPLCA